MIQWDHADATDARSRVGRQEERFPVVPLWKDPGKGVRVLQLTGPGEIEALVNRITHAGGANV